jgi:hypothetical protein
MPTGPSRPLAHLCRARGVPHSAREEVNGSAHA